MSWLMPSVPLAGIVSPARGGWWWLASPVPLVAVAGRVLPFLSGAPKQPPVEGVG